MSQLLVYISHMLKTRKDENCNVTAGMDELQSRVIDIATIPVKIGCTQVVPPKAKPLQTKCS